MLSSKMSSLLGALVGAALTLWGTYYFEDVEHMALSVPCYQEQKMAISSGEVEEDKEDSQEVMKRRKCNSRDYEEKAVRKANSDVSLYNSF
jgi:hypothetical protein